MNADAQPRIQTALQEADYKFLRIDRGANKYINFPKRMGIVVNMSDDVITTHQITDSYEWIEPSTDFANLAELEACARKLREIAGIAIETSDPDPIPDLPEGDDPPLEKTPISNAPDNLPPAESLVAPTPTPKSTDSEPKPANVKTDIPAKRVVGVDIMKIIDDIVGNDVLELFGPTGSGKSKFSLYVAQEYARAGKTVYYLDTERNLTKEDIDSLKGCTYKYTPDIAEVEKITQHLPEVDLVIIDSIGFPILTTYARLSVKQKGDALLKMIAIFGDLKLWAYHNNGVAIVTNQPESSFNKEKGHVLRPFGDKSQFAAKEIWWLKPGTLSEKLTSSSITAFRSRSMGRNTKIATLEMTDAGVGVV